MGWSTYVEGIRLGGQTRYYIEQTPRHDLTWSNAELTLMAATLRSAVDRFVQTLPRLLGTVGTTPPICRRVAVAFGDMGNVPTAGKRGWLARAFRLAYRTVGRVAEWFKAQAWKA